MSADLKSQLADYGRYLRDHQEAIDLREITDDNAVLLAPGIEADFGHDPAIDVEIAITPIQEEDSMNLKASTLLLLAAAAVIVIAGIVVVIESRSDDRSPVISDEIPTSTTATPEARPATPEEIGASFIRARDSWDAEATVSLFAPDPSIDDLEVSTLEDYEAQYVWYEAVGWNWEPGECIEATPGSGPASVTCAFTMENDWSRALGLGPFDGTFEFEIVDGQIAAVSTAFPSGFSRPVWQVFKQWVRDNHLSDYSVMYDVSGSLDSPHFTSQSMDLWEQHTAGFVAATTGQ